MQITNIEEGPIKGLTVKMLFQTETSEILLFRMKAGESIPNHISPKTAFLVMHKGKIVFHIKEENIELESGNTYEIPKNILHKVNAHTDAIFFIVR